MKKSFLYLSFFAAAFLVSCKSNEVEETPVQETVETPVETVEEVVEEIVEEAPVENTKSNNKPAGKTTTKVESQTTTVSPSAANNKVNKVKEAQDTKTISNASGEATLDEKQAADKASKVKIK